MDRTLYSSLSRSDSRTAVGSYPRRFRTLVRENERAKASAGQELAEIFGLVGPDGVSAATIVATVTTRFGTIEEALRVGAVLDNPRVGREVLTDTGSVDVASGAEQLLAALETAAGSLATRMDSVENHDVGRTVSVDGAESLTLLDLMHEAVAVGRHQLDALEATLAFVSR